MDPVDNRMLDFDYSTYYDTDMDSSSLDSRVRLGRVDEENFETFFKKMIFFKSII